MNTPPDIAATVDVSAGSDDDPDVAIPDYLEKYYWWAYVRPWAVRLFEREWLINLILWGWYRPLRDLALAAFDNLLPGRTLQISCCYGSFTPTLAERVRAADGSLDVVDVSLPQIKNLRRKLQGNAAARVMRRDAADLGLPDVSYDRVIMFFLPHEQPREARERSFAEAWRVLKPGGKLLIIEFGKPKWWHPLRYFYLPFLRFLEPFAPDIWGHELYAWLPGYMAGCVSEQKSLFGGYYQRIIIRKN